MSDLTFDQLAPIFNATLLAGVQLTGAASQRSADHILADHAQAIARGKMADQKVLNRIVLSAARARGLQSGTDKPNLDIIAQLAIEGERRVRRIKENGELTAAYYRNQADAGLYDALGSAAFTLGQGFASAYERGAFTTTPKDTSVDLTFQTQPSGPPQLVAPGVATGGNVIPSGVSVGI